MGAARRARPPTRADAGRPVKRPPCIGPPQASVLTRKRSARTRSGANSRAAASTAQHGLTRSRSSEGHRATYREYETLAWATRRQAPPQQMNTLLAGRPCPWGVDSADGGRPPVQTAAAEDDGGARQRRPPLFRCRLVEVRLVEGPRAREARGKAPGSRARGFPSAIGALPPAGDRHGSR